LPGPTVISGGPPQFQCNNLDYDNYVGRLAIGRIKNGELATAATYAWIRADGSVAPVKITQIYGWRGLKRIEGPRAGAGAGGAGAGMGDIDMGDTIADLEHPKALPPIRVDEPTIAMVFAVNTAPWAGREGEYVTSRKLRERLEQERRRNVSIRIEDTESPDAM